MHRLDRRRIVLEGKRNSAFDPNQYYFEKSERTRLLRRARVLLRGGTPLIVITPRWSRAQSFLDDLATDLALGEPSIKARSLGLQSLKGLTVHQAWAWMAAAVAEFCQVTVMDTDGGSRPVWQAVSRRGFREVLADVLARAEGGRKRCLLFHGLEHAHIEAVQDLFEVFAEHVARAGPDRDVNFLFAGSIEAPYQQDDTERMFLADFSTDEAVEALVEFHGPLPEERLENVVKIVGGVPELLEALGHNDPERLIEILMDRDVLWAALGPVGEEVRAALDLISADAVLSTRLERLARLGEQPAEEADKALLRAGLIRQRHTRHTTISEIRAPWFVDLALST